MEYREVWNEDTNRTYMPYAEFIAMLEAAKAAFEAEGVKDIFVTMGSHRGWAVLHLQDKKQE